MVRNKPNPPASANLTPPSSASGAALRLEKLRKVLSFREQRRLKGKCPPDANLGASRRMPGRSLDNFFSK